MERLKVAVNQRIMPLIEVSREVVDLSTADLTEVSAIVVSSEDVRQGMLQILEETGFDIPIFLFLESDEKASKAAIGNVVGVISDDIANQRHFGRQIDEAAQRYENNLLPPFFKELNRFVKQGNSVFNSPGHQGGSFFKKHPAGRIFHEFFGETIFISDTCNAEVEIGKKLSFEERLSESQEEASKVFCADKTYFVPSGIPTANAIVLNSILTPGDLVLLDRSSHPSIYEGALVHAGATPVFLHSFFNHFGQIGGINVKCLEENYLRSLIELASPKKALEKRPCRLAVFQLGSQDGIIHNCRQIVESIGHLCDYILFESDWVGHEQFVPILKDCSPLLLALEPTDPGIFVTQSVHKQLAGYSQGAQIHKKDSHVEGQSRYVPHARINNALLKFGCPQPFYPVLASLDINAKLHSGKTGLKLWEETVKKAVEARKLLLRTCRLIRPFIPPKVKGRLWQEHSTEQISTDLEFFSLSTKDNWHGFVDHGENSLYIDPCKLVCLTSGIDPRTGEYDKFGIPATILAAYLRENCIVPEKWDWYSLVFAITPGTTKNNIDRLVSQIVRFERLLEADVSMKEALPSIYSAYGTRYQGYTLQQLCQKIHHFYARYRINELQRRLFQRSIPPMMCNSQKLHYAVVRGEVELISAKEAQGRMMAENIFSYPSGITAGYPGETWSEAHMMYFFTLELGANYYPGFMPKTHGIHLFQEPNGWKSFNIHVLTKETTKRFLKKKPK